MLLQHLILALFWIMFSLFHSVFAMSKWKVFMQALMKEKYKYYRILYSVFACITLCGILVYHFSLESVKLWQPLMIENFFAIAGMVCGASLMIVFTKKFFFDLSGGDVFLKNKKQEVLIQTSLYKYVRHPLYTATLLFVWSLFFYQPFVNNLITCICITVYTIVGIYFEERKLLKDFGASYMQYRATTPMLIPKFKTIL